MPEFIRRRWVYHVASWVLIIVLVVFTDPDLPSGPRSLLELVRNAVKIFLPMICCVYAAFYAKRRFLLPRQYGRFFLVYLITVIGCTYLYELIYVILDQQYMSFYANAQNMIFVFLIAMGFQSLKHNLIDQYQLEKLRARNSEIELVALRFQLNPHFLFNTLNNIYGLNQLDARRGSQAILQLSEVMRYHLSFTKKEHLLLTEELELLTAYIELERLRLGPNFSFTFTQNIECHGIMVAPLILLPFVENAFKHGTHPTKPCFVTISLILRDRTLTYRVHNSIIPHRHTVKTNFGLQNSRDRLALLYPDRHELNIEATPATYRVRLSLQL